MLKKRCLQQRACILIDTSHNRTAMLQRSEACMKWFVQELGRLLAYLCTRMPGVEDAELLLRITAYSHRLLHRRQ